MTTGVKETAVTFSGPEVRVALDGRKTQFRRAVFRDDPRHHMPWRVSGTHWQDGDERLRCPYEAGARPRVRETWRCNHFAGMRIEYKAGGACLEFHDWPKDAVPPYAVPGSAAQVRRTERQLNGERIPDAWRPPNHMPVWASRLTLEITDVRVERLQSINEADALADGGWTYATCPIHKAPERSFAELWDTLNARRGLGWKTNPWVWCVSFRRVKS